MNQSDSYEIREYRESDFPEVMELYDLIYKNYMDEKLWKWKYFSPLRRSPQILVAASKGKIIGIQPASFNRLNVKDQEAYACLLTDVVTHPEQRKRGVFSSLVRESMKHALGKNAPLIYTFPNDRSFPGFIEKLQWHHIFSIPLYLKILDMQKLSREMPEQRAARFLLSLMRPFQSLLFRDAHAEEEECSISEDADLNAAPLHSLIQDSLGHYPISVARDKDYFEWRYRSNPRFSYKIIQTFIGGKMTGILIFRVGKLKSMNICFICEFIVDGSSLSSGHALLKKLESHLKDSKINIVGCLMMKGRTESIVLKNAGYRIVPASIAGKEFYLVGNFDERQISREFFLNRHNWFMTWGDSDIV